VEDNEPIAGYENKRAMLQALYIEEGLSITQLAKRLDVSNFTLFRWMTELDFPRRPRGGAHAPGRVLWKLHRLDPRVLHKSRDVHIAKWLSCSVSIVYKFKRGVYLTWSSPSLAPPVDLNDTGS
jgi:transposase